jgi:hypothetical protein
MFAGILRIFGFSLLGICFLGVNLTLVFVVLLVRFLPRSFPWIRQGLRVFLIFSFRTYKFILVRMASGVKDAFGVDILTGHWRLVTCTTISLLLCLSILLLTRAQISGWPIGLSCLHGLFVALIWDEMEDPEGIHLGARLL